MIFFFSISDLYRIYTKHPSVQIDSRKVKEGDIFFAIRGERYNGHDFIAEALQKGASFAIIDQEPDKNVDTQRLLQVQDRLRCSQDLAHYHRMHLGLPLIALTGSNGKTTTKELLHAVLQKKYHCVATKGNLNNHIGIPLTLLDLREDTDIGIIEMGANHVGEIASYTSYIEPDYGIITNIGKAHVGYFGGIEGVRKAKGELFEYVRTKKPSSVAFVCSDDAYLMEQSSGLTVRTYGTKDPAEVQGEVVHTSHPFLTVRITFQHTTYNLTTQLVGAYNLPNILCAFCVGVYFGVAGGDIQHAIESYTPSNGRSQWLQHATNHFIVDAYNANPSSMRLAIESFASLHLPHKIVILGEMKELGEDSLSEHQQIIELLKQYTWEKVVLVGADFMRTKHNYTAFHTIQEVKDWFEQEGIHGANILLKGSRSVGMEALISSTTSSE